MRTLGLLVVAAACHGGKSANRPLPKRTPYLMLFELGRTWTLPSAGGAVTCKVAEVKQVGDANVSRLDCGALLVSGTWVSTPAGLYHPHLPVDEPDELALLGEDDLLIGAVPKERDHDHVLQGGAQDAIEAFGFEGSWCVFQSTRTAAEHRAYTLCFDGTDITGGAEDTGAGGARQRVTFGKAPPEPAADQADQEDSAD